MKKLTKQILAFLAVSAFALPASAIVIGPGTVGEDSLQTILNNITVDGDSSVDVANDWLSDDSDSYWSSTASGGSVATYIIEIAGNADTNTFGIYDINDASNSVTVFAGAASTGTQVTISIRFDGSVYLNGSDTGKDFSLIDGGNDAFGFFLGTTGGNFYSDTSLNADGFDHLAVYQGTNTDTIQIPGFTPGTWTDNEFLLAWEDLAGGGDGDYNDLVLMVESIEPVPEPAILSLLALGLIGVGAARRRQV